MDCFKIGVLGAVDSGKSTLIGVLKTNLNDDGRGLVRKYVMKHNHEVESGRTSCISYNTIKIEDKLFNFVDLAGHESYLKTTIYGLNVLELDYVLIIIGANMGVNNMTREHFNLARVLKLPIIFVINKIDICPENIINETLKDLRIMVKSKKCEIKPLEIVENNHLLDNGENTKILFYNSESKKILLNNEIDLIKDYDKICHKKKIKMMENIEERYTPIFFTSNKLGYGINNLRNYLCKIHKIKSNILDIIKTNEKNPTIFIIQETYTIKGIGLVFYGYLKSGQIGRNDVIKIGPFGSQFYNIHIRNIRDVLDNDVDTLYKGQLGCLAIKQLSKDFIFKREHIKKGIYITSDPYCCQQFIARINILHHPTTIRKNYQSTIHCGGVIQAARIVEILNIKNDIHTDEDKLLRTGDVAKVKFEFLFRPEFVEDNALFIFRENNAKGVGRILSTFNI